MRNQTDDGQRQRIDAGDFRGVIQGDDDTSIRSFSITPSTWNAEKRSVEAVIATENPVPMLDVRTWSIIHEVLRMDGVELPEGNKLPLQDTHDITTVRNTLGSTVNIRVEGSQLVGDNIISSAEEDVATKVSEGHITGNSVRYNVLTREIIDPGDTREVNGVTYTASDVPLHVATRWRPRENSLTPIGADDAAKIRSKVFAVVGGSEMPEDQNTDATKEAVASDPPNAEAVDTGTANTDTVRVAIDAGEDRKASLRAITPDGDAFEALLKKAVINGSTLEEYRTALLEEYARRYEPAGTPDAPPAEGAGEGLKEIDDEDFVRSF